MQVFFTKKQKGTSQGYVYAITRREEEGETTRVKYNDNEVLAILPGNFNSACFFLNKLNEIYMYLLFE